MTYVEKVVMEIGGSVANHHCNQRMATLIVEKIIADTTRAHVEIINTAREEGITDLRSIRARIEQAEVKEQEK